MKNNRKILKFLTILVSAAIVSNFSFVFAKKEKQTQNVEKEENTKNSEKVLKPLTNEEKRKKQEEAKKRNEEIYNLMNKKDKNLFNKNKEIFKNFKKELYEKISNFTLKAVYFKNNVPILLFEHEETKALIIIIPTNSMNTKSIYNAPNNKYFFRAFEPNDKGLLAFSQHFIEDGFYEDGNDFRRLQEKYKKSNLNVNYSADGLTISTSDYDEADFLDKFFSQLRKPEILKYDERFEKEKKKILFNRMRRESRNKEYSKEGYEFLKPGEEEYYSSEGVSKEMKNVTRKEIEKFFEEKFHPSNLLLIKHTELNPEKIKKSLEKLHEKYLKHFSFKKVSVVPLKKKKNSTYEEYKYSNKRRYEDCSGNEKYFNYIASFSIPYFDENFILNKKNIRALQELNFSRWKLLDGFAKKLEDYIKNLGYAGGDVYGVFNIDLYGNEKKLFEKETLKNNFIKIIKFILNEIKNFSDKEIEEILFNSISFRSHGHGSDDYEDYYFNLFSRPDCFSLNSLSSVLLKNFVNFNEPFSEEIFKITNKNEIKEIKDSKQDLINKVREEAEKFDVDLLIKTKCYKITFNDYDKGAEEKRISSKEYNKNNYYLPIEITKNKNNLLLEIMAKKFIVEDFLTKKMEQNGEIFEEPSAVNFFGSYVGVIYSMTKQRSKKVLDFYLKDFEKSINEVKIPREKFENIKKFLKESSKDIKKRKFLIREEIGFKEVLNAINYYLKHGLSKSTKSSEKQEKFKINEKTTREDLFGLVSYLGDSVHKNKEDFLELKKLKNIFISKYGKIFKTNGKDGKILIDKQYVEDLKKYIIEPQLKNFNNTKKFFKEMCEEVSNKLENVEFKDFIETVKSAKIVEKEKYEKDQKIFNELEDKTKQLTIR